MAVLLTNYFSGSLVLDDATYWDLARAVADGTTDAWDPYESGLYSSTRTFSMPLAATYAIFGPSKLAGQILVALVGALAVIVVFALARQVLGPKPAYFSAAIVAFLPSQVVWSSLILKDAFVWTTLAIIAFFFTKATQSERAKQLAGWLLAIVAGTWALAYLRPHSLVVCCFALALASWVGVAKFRWLKMAFFLILLVTVPWIRGFGPAGWILISSAETITQIREANAVGAESAFVEPPPPIPPEVKVITQEIEVLRAEQQVLTQQVEEAATSKEKGRLNEQIGALDTRIAEEEMRAQIITQEYDPSRAVGVKHVVRGLSVMLAEPYPWDSPTSPSFKMAQAEAIVWYPVLFLALLGLLPAFRERRVMLFPLLVGGGALIVYALAEGNVGSAFRHRSEFTWVIALVAGFGWQNLVGWRRAHRAATIDQPAV